MQNVFTILERANMYFLTRNMKSPFKLAKDNYFVDFK